MDLTIAERLGGAQFGKTTENYKFERIKRAKAEVRKAHPDTQIIDMGVGESDMLTQITELCRYWRKKPGKRKIADMRIMASLNFRRLRRTIWNACSRCAIFAEGGAYLYVALG